VALGSAIFIATVQKTSSGTFGELQYTAGTILVSGVRAKTQYEIGLF
jgi:hypothetical protein